jgi:allophanate hydrolase subunit 2
MDKPPIDSLFYITAIVDHYAVTVSLNRLVHAINLKAVLEIQLGGITVRLQ